MSKKPRSQQIDDYREIGPRDRPGDIILIDQAPHLHVLSFSIHNGVRHVVQKSNLKSEHETQFAELALTTPQVFFQYPLASILGASTLDQDSESRFTGVSREIQHVSELPSVIESFGDYFKTLTASATLLNDALTVVDEAVSNAIYNAPFEQSGKVPRQRQGPGPLIEDHKRPFVFAGSDGDRLVIGCRDSYGSLDPAKLMTKIKSWYENNSVRMINFNEGGAGIGSFLMFHSCASMYIGVERAKSTIMCFSFPFRLSATKRGEINKNIHLITL